MGTAPAGQRKDDGTRQPEAEFSSRARLSTSPLRLCITTLTRPSKFSIVDRVIRDEVSLVKPPGF